MWVERVPVLTRGRMPLSEVQRRLMDLHIRAHTAYNWARTGGEDARTYLIDCMERLLDSRKSVQRDLFLPHALINEHEHEHFWFMMALEFGDMVEWHELKTKCGRDWTRHVYTWRRAGDTEAVFRVLLLRVGPGMMWYGGKWGGEGDGSGDEIDRGDS